MAPWVKPSTQPTSKLTTQATLARTKVPTKPTTLPTADLTHAPTIKKHFCQHKSQPPYLSSTNIGSDQQTHSSSTCWPTHPSLLWVNLVVRCPCGKWLACKWRLACPKCQWRLPRCVGQILLNATLLQQEPDLLMPPTRRLIRQEWNECEFSLWRRWLCFQGILFIKVLNVIRALHLASYVNRATFSKFFKNVGSLVAWPLRVTDK